MTGNTRENRDQNDQGKYAKDGKNADTACFMAPELSDHLLGLSDALSGVTLNLLENICLTGTGRRLFLFRPGCIGCICFRNGFFHCFSTFIICHINNPFLSMTCFPAACPSRQDSHVGFIITKKF